MFYTDLADLLHYFIVNNLKCMFMFLSIHNKTKIVISFIFHVMLVFDNKIKIKPLLLISIFLILEWLLPKGAKSKQLSKMFLKKWILKTLKLK